MDKNRRNFLKVLLIGGGAFLAGKVLGPVFSFIVNGPSIETKFTSFRAVENKKGLTVYDDEGEEIFIMDNKKE